MKVKIDVAEELWRKVKSQAALSGDTLSDFVGLALNNQLIHRTVADPPFITHPEVPTAKCRKCFDVFPVADMVTDPKSGKLFCGSCVENMRNQQ